MLHYLTKHYCKLAGIPEEKAHFHALKHTCGTIMLSVLKESIVDVQHHLGHADIRSTMVYAKLTSEQANEDQDPSQKMEIDKHIRLSEFVETPDIANIPDFLDKRTPNGTHGTQNGPKNTPLFG